MSESQQSQQVPKKTGRRTADNPVDWELIEKEFRAGHSTLRQMALAHGVDHAAIGRMAKRRGWTQDRRAEVKARSEAQLLLISKSPPIEKSTSTLDQVIDDAATRRTNVILAHRAHSLRGRTLAMTMLAQLETMTEAPMLIKDLQACLAQCQAGEDIPHAILARADTLLGQALTLDNRAGVLKSLIESLKGIVAIEREAFGINDPTPPPVDQAAGAFTDFAVFKAQFMAIVARHQGAQM